MKKRILALLLSFCVAGGLAACGSSSDVDTSADNLSADSTEAEGSAGGTVNVYISSDLEAQLDEEIAAYQEVNPDVEIVKHVIANDDYDDKIKVLLAGGSEDVDVFWARTPATLNQYKSAGSVEDLSSYAENSGVDLSSIMDTCLAAISDADGGFYGLPIYSSSWMLFYNKELFDEAGLDYPTEQMTWDEYCELAESLTHTEGDTKYYGGQCPNWTMNLGAIAAGEYLTDEAPLEKTQEYLEITNRMYSNSHVSLEEMSNGSWDNNSSFANGNIYMMILGDWGYRDLDCDFEYGTAPLPIMDGVEEGTSAGNACYLCMSTNSSNKQASYDFIEFFTTSDEGTTITAQAGNVPSYSTDAALEAYQESVQVDGVEYRFASRVLAEDGSDENYSAIYEAFSQEAQLYLLGEETIDECMENFYQLRDEIMEQ